MNLRDRLNWIVLVLGLLLCTTIGFAVLNLVRHRWGLLDLWTTAIPMALAIVIAIFATVSPTIRRRDLDAAAAERARSLADRVGTDLRTASHERGLDADRLLHVPWRLSSRSDRAAGLHERLEDGGQLERLVDRVADHARGGSPTRLVVTGEGGAGKTAVCILLALALAEGSPATFPVVFSVASWRSGTSLRRWMADELLINHARQVRDDQHGRTVAEEIVARYVLPVLDGLDQLADPSAFLRAVEDELQGRSFVLSGRTAEFARADTDERILRRACVVELLPLPVADIRKALAASVPEGAASRPILDATLSRLRSHPSGPLRDALSTPLYLALAVHLGGRIPRELMESDETDAVQRIQKYLWGAFVSAAYRLGPQPRPDEVGPVEAEQILRFLAGRADPATGRLAWWRLHTQVPGMLAVGVAVLNGAWVCGLAAGLYFELFERPWIGVWIGVLCGAVGGVVVEALPADQPRRARPALGTAIQRRSDQGALLRTLGFGFLGGVACAAMVWFLYARVQLVATAFVLSGLTFAAARWVSEPTNLMETVTPRGILTADRAVVGYTCAVGFLPGALTGAYLGAKLPSAHRSPEFDHLRILTDLSHTQLILLCAVGGGLLSCLGLGLLAFGASSWGRFVLVRLWLASRRHTPMQLMTFLQDACSKGVLRQVNGLFEFRHQLLHAHLLHAHLVEPDQDQPPPPAPAPTPVPTAEPNP
ncbi:hypothetical protein [Peterkaempfera sp. SMS 1(5)a]|uniref:hypothetical protein n=1 Tax=Peterkaempfera podocarpi TaxID=3232308 RepID=UPI003670E6A6